MSKLYLRRSKKVGLSPGTLLPPEEKPTTFRLTLFDYDVHHYTEKELQNIEEALEYKDRPTVTWINVDGVHRVDVLEALGRHFDIHPLVLEDVVNAGQRPKMEDYDHYVFIVTKMLIYDEEAHTIRGEQISLVQGAHFVISFQEHVGDIFDIIRQRIRTNESRLRNHGTDYLVYRLLDTIVDHYFVVLEKLGERIEDLDEWIVEEPSHEAVAEIYALKREMIFLRRSVWPLREVISGLTRDENKLIRKNTRVFLRDVYDHTIQVIDTVENFRDLLSGMLDLYLSTVSNRMNEIMKVLTIIATIFIPLTFLVGIYGMNFNPEASPWNMPELNWYWGYPASLGLMALVALGLLFFFKRKGWL